MRFPNRYSPAVKLAFMVIKGVFLFVIGICLACVLAACLDAAPVAVILINLLKGVLGSLTALALGVVAIAVVLESLE